MKNLNGNPRSRALGGCVSSPKGDGSNRREAKERSYRPQSGLCSGEE